MFGLLKQIRLNSSTISPIKGEAKIHFYYFILLGLYVSVCLCTFMPFYAQYQIQNTTVLRCLLLVPCRVLRGFLIRELPKSSITRSKRTSLKTSQTSIEHKYKDAAAFTQSHFTVNYIVY